MTTLTTTGPRPLGRRRQARAAPGRSDLSAVYDPSLTTPEQITA